MEEKTRKPLSEARKKSNAKYIKAHYQYITFAAKKGYRDRIVQAATIKGETINGFIRRAVDKALEEANSQSAEYDSNSMK